MRLRHALPTLVGLVFLSMGGSGCATTKLREANQRLKESNDRLVSENNQLKDKIVEMEDQLRSGPVRADPGLSAPPAPAEARPAIQTETLPPIADDPDIEQIQTDNELRFRMKGTVFFALGQAKLSSRGERALAQIGQEIRRNHTQSTIRVEGHTDDVPVRKVRHKYPTNWELSTARACTVVRYLTEKGFADPQQIFPVGYSKYRPLDSRRTSSARQKNRRVEIAISAPGS